VISTFKRFPDPDVAGQEHKLTLSLRKEKRRSGFAKQNFKYALRTANWLNHEVRVSE